MSYMIRYSKRGANHWSSIMDHENNVKEFTSEREAHWTKEILEQASSETHTYNVYAYDASAK